LSGRNSTYRLVQISRTGSGPDTADNVQRAIGYIEKILKGANPADLPIESSDKTSLTVNSKAAKDLGIAIPPQVQARADSIIE
jgi:putative tryptophan/tyrosine transport system substrate-binding protein